MSGHSKWHKIQHKKGITDVKRSGLFTKLARGIAVAAQQGGGDPEMNFSLRLAIEKAKASNMPKDNVERAIKRGAGELKDGVVLQETLYESFGPGGLAVLIEAVSDNPTRTVADIKHILSKYDCSLGGPGTVKWQFAQKGIIRFEKERKSKIDNWEDAQLKLMDAGAEDIREDENGIEIVVGKDKLGVLIEAVTGIGIEPDDSGLEWLAKEERELNHDDSAKMEELYEALLELDDIREIYTNEA